MEGAARASFPAGCHSASPLPVPDLEVVEDDGTLLIMRGWEKRISLLKLYSTPQTKLTKPQSARRK